MTHSLWPLLVAVVICLLYLNMRGFPEPVCRFVRDQFRQYGYIVQFESLRLDWFSGIVAEKLSLADARRPDKTLVRVTEVGLQIAWLELLNGQHALHGLRIINANISAPMPPDELGSENFTASEAHATLRFEENGAIRLEQLTGTYCGVFLYVTGRVKPTVGLPPVPAARTNDLGVVSKALRELHSLRSSKPLDLYLDFDIDLAQPMALQTRVRLHGRSVRYRRLAIEQIELDVGMEEGAVRIRSANARLAGGELDVRGTYDVARGQTDLHLRSTFDLMVLRPLLPPETEKALPPFRFLQNPNINLHYVLSPETGTIPVVSGKIHVGDFEFRGVGFREIAFGFEHRGPEIKVLDARIVMREGELTGHGQYHIESSDFSYEFDSTLDPTDLLPLMTPMMQRWMSPATFEEVPHIIAKVRGDFVDPDAFAYDAEVKAGRGSYRGVALEAAEGRLRLRRNRLEARELVFKREDGELTGELTADFDQQQLVFNMRTTANPTPMAALLGEKAAKTMEPYRFGPELSASAKGFVDFANPQRVTWTADVTDTGFSWWKLTANQGRAHLLFTNDLCHLRLDTKGATYGTNHAERVAADLLIAQGVVKATNVVATIAGGKIEGHAITDIQRQRVAFQFRSTADPHALAALLGPAAEKKLQPYSFGFDTVVRASGIADLQASNQTAWVAELATDSFGYQQLSAKQLNANLALTNEVLRIQANAQHLNWWTIKGDRVQADLTFANDTLQSRLSAHALQWWKLKTDEVSANITGSNSAYAIRNFDAAIHGGTLRGQADLHPVGTNTAFQLNLDANQWDMQRFVQSMGKTNANTGGQIAGRLSLTGTGADFATYQGDGTLEIANGVLMEVPLFGIFSSILNLIVPNLGSTAITKANCTYTIANQLIKTDDLKFTTGAAAVSSRGTITIPKGDLDFRVEAQPLRSWPGINILTWMFGKIFEYKVGGTLDNPNWRPTRLPKELMPHSEGKPAETKPDNP
jgi:uncharacterized protein involved in outer membrane biogenesis